METGLASYDCKQALALHDQMVKQMKGVPGVHMDRLADARTVRHCALSLVGANHVSKNQRNAR